MSALFVFAPAVFRLFQLAGGVAATLPKYGVVLLLQLESI
jgi:hypothetical protein